MSAPTKYKVGLTSPQRLEEQSAKINLQRSVLKFVLLWIVFNVIGLIFDVINQGWHTATGNDDGRFPRVGYAPTGETSP